MVPRAYCLQQRRERLLATAREVLSHVSTAESDIVRIGSGHNTVLRIAIQCFTLYHWLPAVLVDYAVACPSIEVRIEADATIAPIEALLDGELDVAFSLPCHVIDDSWRSRCSMTNWFAVVSSDHGLAKKDFVDAADFSDEHVLMCMPRRHERFILGGRVSAAGDRASPGFIRSAFRRNCRNGQGWRRNQPAAALDGGSAGPRQRDRRGCR